MLDLFTPGTYARVPSGHLERPQDQAPVISWVAWNIGNDPTVEGNPAVWDHARSIWEGAGIATFPWLHCRSLADVEFLIQVAEQKNSPAIGLNLEDVAKDFTGKGVSLDDVAQTVARWQGPIHLATLPWVQNGQGWDALARCVAALEIMCDEQTNTFPGGVYDPVLVRQCIQHAFDEGFELVTLMLKTKAPWTRESYGDEFHICHSLYPMGEITPSAEGWASWDYDGPWEIPGGSDGGGGDMPQVGYNDGIRAFHNMQRKLDPTATRAPDGVPKNVDLAAHMASLGYPNVDDWKAIDKHERMEQIIKDDHDGAV